MTMVRDNVAFSWGPVLVVKSLKPAYVGHASVEVPLAK
jgi:hypothetical protein